MERMNLRSISSADLVSDLAQLEDDMLAAREDNDIEEGRRIRLVIREIALELEERDVAALPQPAQEA